MNNILNKKIASCYNQGILFNENKTFVKALILRKQKLASLASLCYNGGNVFTLKALYLKQNILQFSQKVYSGYTSFLKVVL